MIGILRIVQCEDIGILRIVQDEDIGILRIVQCEDIAWVQRQSDMTTVYQTAMYYPDTGICPMFG